MATVESSYPFGIGRLLAVPFVTASVWVGLEWLFFVTKPSFMSLFSTAESLGVLTHSILVTAVALVAASLPFALVGRLLANKRVAPPVITVTGLFPAILLAASTLLVLMDNFTLTVFGWGVRSASGYSIWVYRALTAMLFVFSAWIMHGVLFGRHSGPVFRSLLAASILSSMIAVLLLLSTGVRPVESRIDLPSDLSGLPNVIIFSGDGISANHMSFYGYERKTTPFLEKVQDEFLVAENQFGNASDTGGAVISLLTGKLPTTTGVIYPPDSLRGRDSFQHLPGILRTVGYYNVDISVRHYADPYDLNLRKGFDEANFRKLAGLGDRPTSILHLDPRFGPSSQLIDRITERILDRYLHIWRNEPMGNPQEAVDDPESRWVRDAHRMAEIRRVVHEAPRPFFLHVHTMGTHGKRFRPPQRIWSTEEDYEEIWNVDGYDDSILAFDRMLESIYGLLRETETLDETILVISSDHGFRHSATQRLPLLVRFPGTSITGRMAGNTQRLDIAPTLLDALGIAPPSWMEGESLIDPDFNGGARNIFAVGTSADRALEDNFWFVVNPRPPWYSLGRLFFVHCDQWFKLQVDDMTLTQGTVQGSTSECRNRIGKERAREVILDHLKAKGYSPETE